MAVRGPIWRFFCGVACLNTVHPDVSEAGKVSKALARL